MGLSAFLSKTQQSSIVKAIEDAENCTSGEIRVHIEPKCTNKDTCQRAVEVFNKLKMYETRERNAVLIYIAYKAHKFAIIGDLGINKIVPDNFWESEKLTLASYLKDNKPAEGLCKVIIQIGNSLKSNFPHQPDDINEQSNEISYND